MNGRIPFTAWLIVAALALGMSACNLAGAQQQAGDGTRPAAATPPPAPAVALAPEQSAYPGSKIDADRARGPMGTSITLTGSGFPAGVPVSFTWKTFDGSFALEQEEVVFAGVRYQERLLDLGTVVTDNNGALRLAFTVPEDFGGMHDVIARVDGKFATKMGVVVTATFSVSRTDGPVGTPIEVKATGLGYRTQESQWHVSWDNGFTGYMTAVTTRGTATARMRLAGPPGKHVLKIWRNYRGIPYLNPHQGPFGALPEPSTFVLNVTDGVYEAPNVWTDPKPEDVARPAPSAQVFGTTRLTLSSPKGTVGSKLTLQGEGFPANAPVKLTWASRTGQKITNTGLLEGFDEDVKDLNKIVASAQAGVKTAANTPAAASADGAPVVTGPDGSFSAELTVFDDFAGHHRVTATSGESKAEAYYTIYPHIGEFTAQAKVGEEVRIRMKGVGWTIQGKTYGIVYDNRYLGYGCSFSTRGDIDLRLPAAGSPGMHTIDLYPAVYEGREPTPDIYSKPNLTYLNDHPGGTLPAFRLTLVVTE